MSNRNREVDQVAEDGSRVEPRDLAALHMVP